MRVRIFAMLSTLALGGLITAQSEPLLQLQGQPYFGGSMKLHLSAPAAIGQPALLAYGLNPLTVPLQTGKGPWFIGGLVNLVGIGSIAASGRIDLPFTMPPLMPALAGIPIVMQGYVPSLLSNPATLPLDQSYYEPAEATILVSPTPNAAGLFGDQVAVGDLNGDTALDVVVGAWFEDASGVDTSGRAHIFWGPALDVVTTLQSPSPIYFGCFGQGLAVADFDGDGIEDLVVSEGNGDPPPAAAPGHFYVYVGGPNFSTVASFVVASADDGNPYQTFGHRNCIADFTGDGLPDIAVGVPRYPVQGISNAGRVEIYPGPSFVGAQLLSATQVSTNGFFGDRLSSADLDGDGAADLVVGCPREKFGGVDSMGRVYLFTGPGFTHLKTIDHPDPSGLNSRFGNDVVGRDLNGDGLDDVVATDQRNHAYVFWAPDFDEFTRITRPPDPVTGTAVSISFGYFVASGDVNDDGLLDIVIAEPFAGGMGRVYAALAPYFASSLVLSDKLPTAGNEFGWGVLLRDVDGDGRSELLVGSDLSDPGGVSGAGHVSVFHTD